MDFTINEINIDDINEMDVLEDTEIPAFGLFCGILE